MSKARIILKESRVFDYPNIFKRALLEANIEAEIVQIPFFSVYDLAPDKLQQIKTIIRKRKDSDQFVLFFAGTEEIFLKDPDCSFVCSHYKSLHGRKVEVIPHVWSHIRTPSSIKCPLIARKSTANYQFDGLDNFGLSFSLASKSDPRAQRTGSDI